MKKITILTYWLIIFITSCKKDNSPEIIRTLHVPGEFGTIQAAISNANDYDTILVSNGQYDNINFNGKLVYLTSLYYKSLDTLDIKNTIISGYHNSVVRFENKEDSSAVIDGFSITNGGVQKDNTGMPIHLKGGGIYIKNAHPTLKNLIIENNSMYYPMEQGIGGGIYCDSGTIKGYNLIIRKNYSGGAYGGGGIYATNSKLFLNECTISYNSTGLLYYCGGIFLDKVNFVIQNSKIYHNFLNTTNQPPNLFYNSKGLIINTSFDDYYISNQVY
jgi:hypothetical protein